MSKLKSEFKIRCRTDIFTEEQLQVLKKYGNFMEGLACRGRKPTTSAQTRFIQVCRGEEEPRTIYEVTWVKYQKELNRPKAQAKPKPILTTQSKTPSVLGGITFGGTPDDVKWTRKQRYRDMKSRNRDDYW